MKGLVTEFSDLNYPEDASVDELNCELHVDGSRSKRLGIALETGNTPAPGPTIGGVVTTHKWNAVSRDPNRNYLVLHMGQYLFFYNQGAYPLSGGEVHPEIDLSPYAFGGSAPSPSAAWVDMATSNGDLIVVSESIYPIRIYRDPATNTLNVEEIVPRIRDYTYLGDYYTSGTLGDAADQYDALNCGWVAPPNGTSPLTTYRTAKADTTAVPALSHPWYSGKDSAGDFSVTEWERVYGGSTRITNGHYILSLWQQQYFRHASSLSDIDSGNVDALNLYTAIAAETDADLEALGGPAVPKQGFNCVEAFAGRVFFSGVDSKVYFSPLLVNQTNKGINRFYQENDPTSEEFSDLLSTDGGFLSIPEASNIQRLSVFGSSLLVFAKNGVWRVTGIDDVFKATEYAVFKVTDYGINHRGSFVIGANNQPFWWSDTGIHTIVVDENGFFREISISRSTIQTFWNNIPDTAKDEVVAFFDESKNTLSWLYPTTAGQKKNKMLNFNVDLGAFYPWTLADSTSNLEVVGGLYNYDGAGTGSKVTLIIQNSSTNAVSFGEFTNVNFLDWGETSYSAYAEAAYNFMGDLGRQKNSPYITVLMGITETGWELSGGNYVLVRPSSLKVSGYWDFNTTPASPAQEAYLFRYPLVVGSPSVFDYPTTNLSTRLKLRGRGKVLKVRFEGSEGKDFKLLGWETVDAVNPRY